DLAPHVRAILAPFIPSAAVSVFSGVGIVALRFDAQAAKKLEGQRTIALPAPAQWAEKEPTVVVFGSQKVPLTWLALGQERAWASAGTSRPLPRARS
ncbi:MAG TPA: 3-isopropylmalate dehydratase, partial [Labilithrix sp.]